MRNLSQELKRNKKIQNKKKEFRIFREVGQLKEEESVINKTE